MATTTGTRGVVRGPITSAGVNMGSGLVIMHEFLEFLRKVGKKGAVQLTPKLALGGPQRPRTGSSGTPQALPARHTHPGDTVTGWVARG